jgi:Protein of unknown function (DUF2855)
MDRSLAMQVARDDLRRVRVVEASPAEPGPGEVLFEVERFGVSANNVTYAQLGDALRYWDLFPAEAGWGQIPAWGYLRAVASRAGEVEAGRRAFGLCPMSTHVLLRPGRGDAAGFRDASIHRSAVSPVYNSYFWADGDQPDRRADDGLTVLRPVFWLSFTLDHHLARNGALFSGVVITSASSKAAISQRYTSALTGFAESATWLAIETARGIDEAARLYQRVLDNSSPPAVGHIVDLSAAPRVPPHQAEAGPLAERT